PPPPPPPRGPSPTTPPPRTCPPRCPGKTASAETDEGALGATIDLQTARPFDYKTDTYAFSTEAAWYQNGDYYNPRMTGLIS
ncbi:hypothetical protein, partial [Asticcacaulis sp. YBE204]|uniref:hypothetical protein n=1 Tax=Asticcacaulis sp. YBE204 TaxID=1282363 RepID=UPI0005542B89